MSTLPVPRLFGFEIRVHVSWAIILAVIVVTVATQAERMAPSSDPVVRWAVGGFVALAFLLSALAHELAHAIAARRTGVAHGPIVVYVFGSAASPDLEAERPRDEIVAALAGPLVSLVIGAALCAIALAGAVVADGGDGPALIVGQIALVIGVLNLVLGGVNLLPAYPLDGGRVVRALVWARTGEPARGLLVAARVGRWVGVGLGLIGTIAILTMDSIDGLMLALCGWFLVSSSRGVVRHAEVDALLAGLAVRDVMDHDVASIPAGLTIDTFAAQVLDGSVDSLPVMDGADLVGVLGARQVRRVRRSAWPETRARDLMRAVDALPSIEPGTSLRAALDHLHRTDLDGLPVTEAGAFTGIVTRRAVARAIRDRIIAPPTTPAAGAPPEARP